MILTSPIVYILSLLPVHCLPADRAAQSELVVTEYWPGGGQRGGGSGSSRAHGGKQGRAEAGRARLQSPVLGNGERSHRVQATARKQRGKVREPGAGEQEGAGGGATSGGSTC